MDDRAQPLHVTLFGEVDLNRIDGSAVWLASLAQVLASAGLRVSLLTWTAPARELLLAPLQGLENMRIIDPTAEGWAGRGRSGRLSAGGAVRALERLLERDPFDLAIVRGTRTAARASASARIAPRLWAYLTDIPQPGRPAGPLRHWRTRRICARAHRMLCQTRALERHLQRLCPGVEGICVQLPPMIPDEAVQPAPHQAPAPGDTLRLVYLGKFAPLWNSLEMTVLPAALADAGLPAELQVIGDRFQWSPFGRFETRMRQALEGTPGLVWHRGRARDEALSLAAEAHVGLGWRHRALDRSVELSTKLLEYGALGLPCLLNPTEMHKELYGEDYPLFAGTREDVIAALTRVCRDPDLYDRAARRALEVSRRFTFSSAAERLVPALRARPHA